MKISDEVPESLAAEIRKRHALTNLHIFTVDDRWRVFGFRKDPKGFQASVENGDGETVVAALHDLDRRLKLGPVRARQI